MSLTLFQFADRKGRIWSLELDLLKIRRVDKSDFSNLYPTKFSLARFDKAIIAELLTNSPLMFAVIWALVQDQAELKYLAYTAALGSSPVQTPPQDSFPISPKESPVEAESEFIEGISGPVIDNARAAFLEALSDFFRDQQTALSTIGKTLKSLRQKLVERSKELDPVIDKMLNKHLDSLLRTLSETPGMESTPSQQLPDGIPANSGDLEPVLET